MCHFLVFQPITSWILKKMDASYPKDVIDFFVDVTDQTIQQRYDSGQVKDKPKLSSTLG